MRRWRPRATVPERSAHVVAQAKINLALRVLAREASGYHQIETLLQRLDIGDSVRVRTGVRTDSLDSQGADTGPVEQNLAMRAVRAYRTAGGWPAAVAIEIDKQVPVGGGLGGGSADAGAVLRCLDALSPHPLGTARLLALAGSLGTDVPFLTAEQPLVLAWGRGNRMLTLPPLPARDVVLGLSNTPVATADAYGWLAELRESAASPGSTVLDPVELSDWAGVAAIAVNDFESAVFPRHAESAAWRRDFDDVMRRNAAGPHAIALLSGSGATVALVHEPGAALGERDRWRSTGAAVLHTRTARSVVPVTVDE